MYHLVKSIQELKGNKTPNQVKVISNSTYAIERSREILQQAEVAVTRSYAVVELSKRFVDSIVQPETKSD